jgi:predicted NAD/FAD-binding protein
LPDGEGERADVVVVAVADDDGVDLLLAGFGVERERLAAFVFRVDSGVEQETVSLEVDEPGAGSDVMGRV